MAAPTDDSSRRELLYELALSFAQRLDLNELIPVIVEQCREALGCEGVSVVLLDPEKNELKFPYVSSDDETTVGHLKKARLPADHGIAGAVLKTGEAERIDDVAADPRFNAEVDRATGTHTRSMLVAPLVSRGGALGVIQVVNKADDGTFSDDDLDFLRAMAASIGIALENARLFQGVRRSEQRLRKQVGLLRRDLARLDRFGEMVGSSPTMADVMRLMESAATSPITVLIEGETGTGKELVARGIHTAGERADGPFIAVNCAALPEALLESQLFGHKKGAFTGATQDQRGFFETANGGTIFLDEIGETPAPMQAKLLRVLQESEVVPVGEQRPRKVDARVIAATNRDLRETATSGGFREDLFYRLAAFPIRLPPLRARREDIPPLVEHLLERAAERAKKRIVDIEPDALACLAKFDWPGNVRELQNEIERAVTLARDGDVLGLEHFSQRVGGTSGLGHVEAAPVAGVDTSSMQAGTPLREARAAFEAQFVKEALAREGGNVSQTARVLGISRVMLQQKMKQYGLR